MEDMDIDLLMDIPDTPDRLSVRKIVSWECAKKENSLAVSNQVGTCDTMEEQYSDSLRDTSRLIREYGHPRKLRLPRNKSQRNGGFKNQEEIIDLSSPENKSYSSKDVSLFRRPSAGNNSKHEATSTASDQHLSEGQATCCKVFSKPFGCRKNSSLLDLTEQNGHRKSLEMSSQSRSRKLSAEGRKEGEVQRNDESLLHSSRMSGNTCKGKEKVDDNRFKSVFSVGGHKKGIDLCGGSHEIDKKMSATINSVALPRVTGKKRLVRNGCISPQNIVIRAKKLGEQSQNSSKDVHKHPRDVVSSCPSAIDIADVVAEDNSYRKGKEVVIHPHTSMVHGMNTIDISSSPLNCTVEVSGTKASRKDVRFEGRGGWLSTHNRPKNIDNSSGHHMTGSHGIGSQVNLHDRNAIVKGDAVSGENRKIAFAHDLTGSEGAHHAASTFLSQPNHTSELTKAENMLHRRERKREISLINHGNVSSRVSDDVDITCLGSFGESSSRPSRIHNDQIQHSLDIHDLNVTRQMDSHDDSEARAKQVEADEMLARELQEQLYCEVPILGNGEEEDSILAATYQNHNPRNSRGTRNTRRRPQLHASQNSTRRRGQSRLPTTRMSRLANQILNRPRAATSRTVDFQFPLGMDLDMRLDILEALEAANGDLGDMGTASSMFHAHRDFNENDYEMLLALDDNNHQHGGASIRQINSLPQSVVQNDNFEEACAICLETPANGETIRHLPCLHKFHKDCIDPWLGRKTSCPVCKSSVT